MLHPGLAQISKHLNRGPSYPVTLSQQGNTLKASWPVSCSVKSSMHIFSANTKLLRVNDFCEHGVRHTFCRIFDVDILHKSLKYSKHIVLKIIN